MPTLSLQEVLNGRPAPLITYDSEVIEDIPHRYTVFTIPKRLRVFFKYDRKLNSILFRAAWGALSQVLGIDDANLPLMMAKKINSLFASS